jgi:hypothetical protein
VAPGVEGDAAAVVLGVDPPEDALVLEQRHEVVRRVPRPRRGPPLGQRREERVAHGRVVALGVGGEGRRVEAAEEGRGRPRVDVEGGGAEEDDDVVDAAVVDLGGEGVEGAVEGLVHRECCCVLPTAEELVLLLLLHLRCNCCLLLLLLLRFAASTVVTAATPPPAAGCCSPLLFRVDAALNVSRPKNQGAWVMKAPWKNLCPFP